MKQLGSWLVATATSVLSSCKKREKNNSLTSNTQKENPNQAREKGMGGERKKMLIGLAVAMFLGVAVYFRLWTIDYAISSDDTEVLRRQFDLANRDAMDESAEWRMKYDEEAERAAKCDKKLIEIKQKVEDADSVNQQLAMLQKENMALVERMESLKKELETLKSKCRS